MHSAHRFARSFHPAIQAIVHNSNIYNFGVHSHMNMMVYVSHGVPIWYLCHTYASKRYTHYSNMFFSTANNVVLIEREYVLVVTHMLSYMII